MGIKKKKKSKNINPIRPCEKISCYRIFTFILYAFGCLLPMLLQVLPEGSKILCPSISHEYYYYYSVFKEQDEDLYLYRYVRE